VFKKPLFFVSESSTPKSVVRFSALPLGQVQSFLDYVLFNLLIADIQTFCQVVPIVLRLKFPSVFLLYLVMVNASVDLTQQGL